MRKYLAGAAVALAAATFTSTAAAHTVRPMPFGGSRTVNVVNLAGLSWARIRHFEPGVLQDANLYVRSYWGGRAVTFVNGGSPFRGWRMIFTWRQFRDRAMLGAHGVDRYGPFAVVSVTAARRAGAPVSLVASHELNEMMVDPSSTWATNDGFRVEIVDPVQDQYAVMKGVAVADFVTPDWFVWGSPGPWDAAGVLDTDHETTAGGLAPTVNESAPSHLHRVTLRRGNV